MNILKTYIIAAGLSVGFSGIAVAQQQSSTSVVRKRDKSEQKATVQPGVTQRMQSRFEPNKVGDADLQWMKIVYRQLDVEKDKNAALYYPEEYAEGEENLFRIIMRLLADNKLTAYEYLDGREVFTDRYKLQVRDMLDRFHVLYTDAKGSTEKNPKFTIESSDVPCNEVLSYYIIERWQFDSRTNKTRALVEAICPVLHRSGDFGGEAVKYPMFWVKLDDLRPYLAQQSIFVDDDNNLARYTYDDFFTMNMYDGEIYKTRNLANKSMAQMYPDEDDRKRAQDSIQNRLSKFDSKLWVPSREEVIAARERREAAAAGDSIVIDSRDGVEAEKATRKTARSARAKTPAKIKTKSVKPKTGSSNAVRSVRRRR